MNYLLEKATPASEETDLIVTEDMIREEIIRLVAWGIEPASIAILMAMPLTTLEAEYPNELKHGADILLARCAGRVYDIGMNSKDPRAALPALLAILKFKGNWKDTGKDAGAGGTTINAQAVQFVLPPMMKTEDWQAAADAFRAKVQESTVLDVLDAKLLDKE